MSCMYLVCNIPIRKKRLGEQGIGLILIRY